MGSMEGYTYTPQPGHLLCPPPNTPPASCVTSGGWWTSLSLTFLANGTSCELPALPLDQIGEGLIWHRSLAHSRYSPVLGKSLITWNLRFLIHSMGTIVPTFQSFREHWHIVGAQQTAGASLLPFSITGQHPHGRRGCGPAPGISLNGLGCLGDSLIQWGIQDRGLVSGPGSASQQAPSLVWPQFPHLKHKICPKNTADVQ